MGNLYRNKNNNLRQAFTVVELIIVVLVIGILVSLTVIAYNGIRNKAAETALLSDLDNAISILEHDLSANGVYPDTVELADGGRGLPADSGTTYRYTVDNGLASPTFCLTGTNSTISYYVSTSETAPVEGFCSGHGPIAITVVQKGWSQHTLGTSSPSVLDASAASADTDDLLVAAFCITTTSGTMTAPAGWTQIIPRTTMGTRSIQVFAKIRESGDNTTYLFTPSTAFARRGVLIALDNTAPVSSLVVGSLGIRNVNGTPLTNVAPSITTVVNNTYVLTISAEATTADDTVAPSVTAGGATSWFWSDDASVIEAFVVAGLQQASPGPTSPVTITYQNTQTNNGAAFQLGIPSAP